MGHVLGAVVLVIVAAIGAVPGQAAGARTAEPTDATGPAAVGTGSLTFFDGGRDFGVVTVGATVVDTIALTNVDTGTVTGITISLDDPGASGFAIATVHDTCATGTLSGTASCEVDIRYAPAAVGAATPATLRATGVGTDGSSIETVATLTGWGTSWVERDIPVFTTSGGADVDSTADGDTRYVHAVVSNIEEGWPLGDHADDASEYIRTRSDGRQWGNPLLIGGMVPRLAASGHHVYLTYEAYACGSGIAVRRNNDHGRRGAWSSVICLTRNAELDSMWGPDIAAAGRFVYVVSRSRPLHAAVVRVSRDHGRTWTHASLGHATDTVSVAAAGHVAVVAWTDRGVSYARLSLDGGRHWRPKVRLPAGRVTSAAARRHPGRRRGERAEFRGLGPRLERGIRVACRRPARRRFLGEPGRPSRAGGHRGEPVFAASRPSRSGCGRVVGVRGRRGDLVGGRAHAAERLRGNADLDERWARLRPGRRRRDATASGCADGRRRASAADRRGRAQTRSNAIATEPPPPRHRVAIPYRPPRRAELVEQRRDDPCPGRPDRVAQRDRAAVHVDLRPVEPELAPVRQRLRGERLVDLDQVVGLDRQPGPRLQAAHALDRREEQPLGRHLGLRVADDPGERLQPMLLDRALGGDDRRGRAVGDPGRVAGGDGADRGRTAVLARRQVERGRQAGERLGRRVARAGSRRP